MIEAIAFLALSADIRELGIELRHSAERAYWLARTTAIVAPEYGLQHQFGVGVSAGRLSWDLALGGVAFAEPWPDRGTQLNYVLSARMAWAASEQVLVFIEARHYSNGGDSPTYLHPQHHNRNPAHNALMAGVGWRF